MVFYFFKLSARSFPASAIGKGDGHDSLSALSSELGDFSNLAELY